MSAAFLLHARTDYYERADGEIGSNAYLDYIREYAITTGNIVGFAGVCAVLPIHDCGAGRFDFVGSSDPIRAFVCEAFDADGETIMDVVAWPLDRPDHVLSMFGRAGLLGAWEAMNPATYFMGGVLRVHRTPLDWLAAGCRGAAIVAPHIAARMLLDVPGKIAAADHAHGREIARLIRSAVEKVVVPVKRAA